MWVGWKGYLSFWRTLLRTNLSMSELDTMSTAKMRLNLNFKLFSIVLGQPFVYQQFKLFIFLGGNLAILFNVLLQLLLN